MDSKVHRAVIKPSIYYYKFAKIPCYCHVVLCFWYIIFCFLRVFIYCSHNILNKNRRISRLSGNDARNRTVFTILPNFLPLYKINITLEIHMLLYKPTINILIIIIVIQFSICTKCEDSVREKVNVYYFRTQFILFPTSKCMKQKVNRKWYFSLVTTNYYYCYYFYKKWY